MRNRTVVTALKPHETTSSLSEDGRSTTPFGLMPSDDRPLHGGSHIYRLSYERVPIPALYSLNDRLAVVNVRPLPEEQGLS